MYVDPCSVASLAWFSLGFCPGLLSIPEDKISVLLASIREVSSSHIVTARMLAQVTAVGESFPVCSFLAIFARL